MAESNRSYNEPQPISDETIEGRWKTFKPLWNKAVTKETFRRVLRKNPMMEDEGLLPLVAMVIVGSEFQGISSALQKEMAVNMKKEKQLQKYRTLMQHIDNVRKEDAPDEVCLKEEESVSDVGTYDRMYEDSENQNTVVEATEGVAFKKRKT